MGKRKKLVIVCILALIITFACIQGAPENLQGRDFSITPLENVSTYAELDYDIEPCGGGAGDDVGGGGPL